MENSEIKKKTTNPTEMNLEFLKKSKVMIQMKALFILM